MSAIWHIFIDSESFNQLSLHYSELRDDRHLSGANTYFYWVFSQYTDSYPVLSVCPLLGGCLSTESLLYVLKLTGSVCLSTSREF